MEDVIGLIFKSKFSKSVAKATIITVVFFATVDEFITTLSKNLGIIMLALITFYLLFLIIAFPERKVI